MQIIIFIVTALRVRYSSPDFIMQSSLISYKIFKFTLYSTYNRVNQKNLMLRHSPLLIPPEFYSLRVEWKNSSPRFGSPKQRNKKNSFPQSGDQTYDHDVPNGKFYTLMHNKVVNIDEFYLKKRY